MLDIFMTSEARARRLERNLKRIKEQQRRLAEISKPAPWRELGSWYTPQGAQSDDR